MEARLHRRPAAGPESEESRPPWLELAAPSRMPTPTLGQEVGMASEWAVPWSDLMMVMFIVFAVLFIYDRAEREIASAFRPDDRSAEGLAPDLSLSEETAPIPVFRHSADVLHLGDLENVEVVLQRDESVRVSLQSGVLFETGDAALGAEARELLDRVAPVLARTERPVRVIGHTDNFPIHSPRFPTNWELSAARAAAVARYLIRTGELDPSRFSVVGRSMYAPVVPNASRDGKARNRRVELLIAAPEAAAGTLR